MLDSLGSTLSAQTLNSFFARFHKNPESEELTFDEAVQCLEEELMKPTAERRQVVADEPSTPGTGSLTPSVPDPAIASAALGPLDFTGQAARPLPGESTISGLETNQNPEPCQKVIADPNDPTHFSPPSPSYSDVEDDSGPGIRNDVERVINIKTCPLCHRPRLKGRSEADIVTHLAVCASGDWARVDRIVVGNFVTASQAQRKWYTKMLTKVTSGQYQLGAVCAMGIHVIWRRSFSRLDRTLRISSSRIGLLVSWRKRRCRDMYALALGYCTR
jgi:phosphatidylserine decarboxylase